MDETQRKLGVDQQYQGHGQVEAQEYILLQLVAF
jgi:hypothetical protein